ncbi:glycosyltransferase [Flavobacterium sp.]|uniref:glycosyltransferase n=1 Tax=Flavobacterium sp. TaxID=239 RepID=UPI00404834D6
MKFAIITHVQHIQKESNYFGYAPYIREMNIWIKYADEVVIVAPIVNLDTNPIHDSYKHSKIDFKQVEEFDITSLQNFVKAIIRLPKIIATTYKAMADADHIHLRCPGNMGLIGAIVQILFPKKQKTAKYAGNWDPNANQPFTYKLQRWILSSTFLTKNMQVLVYGEWLHQTKNIKPFFTATYSKKEILTLNENNTELLNKSITQLNAPLQFIFVGTLSKGKQPLYAIQLIEQLIKKGKNVTLDVFGEGEMRNEIEAYIHNKQLEKVVTLKGNQSKETVLKAYQKSHFLILPSKSEGWPKVVAEAMFWGCLPLATSVSCVPYMLDNGKRGIVLKEDIEFDTNQLLETLKNEFMYKNMISEAQKWSRQYTTDTFDSEIQKLINNTI